MNANGRRHRQALNGYKHIAPLRRPHYKARSADAAARRLAEVIATERRISAKRKKA